MIDLVVSAIICFLGGLMVGVVLTTLWLAKHGPQRPPAAPAAPAAEHDPYERLRPRQGPPPPAPGYDRPSHPGERR